MTEENPFYRKRFWYECGKLEFHYFLREAEALARIAIEEIPRARPLALAQSFHVKSYDEMSIQFWFGKHPTGRFHFDDEGKKWPATEDGSYLSYTVGPTGAVAVILYPAKSGVMEANERFLLRHIGPISCYQLCRRLPGDLGDLVAYNYATTLDGSPTFWEWARIHWLRFVSLIEVRGEQHIPMNKTFSGGFGFLLRVGIIALLRPWGILALIIILALFGYDLTAILRKAISLGSAA